ncbi:MAG: RNA methyltransferase [Bacteroidaceae bacterium]|nr:RNA methyltransferase [Bacteroidaceae bacterium]
MISRARIKWIKSLEIRKYRLQENAFVAEGPKLVGELLPYSTPLYVAATKEWLDANRRLLNPSTEVDEVSGQELERASLLRTPQSVLAVMPIPTRRLDVSSLQNQLVIALDNVQDPGNLGTILRIADWFGIHIILCSRGTADVFNPKCVQACMGALARVEVHYCDLPEVLEKVEMPIYGTFLDGKDMYQEELSPVGIIVMGNEGNGISEPIARLITRRLYVPNYPEGALTTESLNVAVATGIVCAEFRRRCPRGII